MITSSAMAMAALLAFEVPAAQPQYVKPPGAVAPATYLVPPTAPTMLYRTAAYQPHTYQSYYYGPGFSYPQTLASGYLAVPNYPTWASNGYPLYSGTTSLYVQPGYGYTNSLYPTWNGKGLYTPYVSPLLYRGP
jgi:hypothetical protein